MDTFSNVSVMNSIASVSCPPIGTSSRRTLWTMVSTMSATNAFVVRRTLACQPDYLTCPTATMAFR